MFTLIIKNLFRRPLRNVLTLAGIAAASAVLVCIIALGDGYRRSLGRELDRSGVQMMIVPLGCPYDAASRVLKNKALETSFPGEVLDRVRQDADVAVAAPLLIAALPRQNDQRTDLWAGLDEAALQLKPWWRCRSGNSWFGAADEVILGADAAALEMRSPRDKFFSPELQRTFRIVGVLERSGTSDDSVFFVPLRTAQEMFGQSNRLTAVAIRLNDPATLRQAAERLQKIPGAQVVTMTEMMGTFLNLLGTMRVLVLGVAAIGITISALSVFNTLLAGVVERTNELAVMRAIGASRGQSFLLLMSEGVLLSLLGTAAGGVLALVLAPYIERIAKHWMLFADTDLLLSISPDLLVYCGTVTLLSGALAGLYPSWRAARLQPAVATKPA